MSVHEEIEAAKQLYKELRPRLEADSEADSPSAAIEPDFQPQTPEFTDAPHIENYSVPVSEYPAQLIADLEAENLELKRLAVAAIEQARQAFELMPAQPPSEQDLLTELAALAADLRESEIAECKREVQAFRRELRRRHRRWWFFR